MGPSKYFPFPPRRIFQRFWAPPGRSLGPTFATFWRSFGELVDFLCLKVPGESPGTDLGCPGTPLGRIFHDFRMDFGRDLRAHFPPSSSHVSSRSATSRTKSFPKMKHTSFQFCPKFDQILHHWVLHLLFLPLVAPTQGAAVTRSVLNPPPLWPASLGPWLKVRPYLGGLALPYPPGDRRQTADPLPSETA